MEPDDKKKPKIPEGTFAAKTIAAVSGVDDKRYVTARVTFELAAGPAAGQRIDYNGRVDARSAPYIARDLKAVGWRGKTLDSLAADVEAAGFVTVPIVIEHRLTKDGARTFAVVQSIGRGAKPLQKATESDIREADDMLSRALASDGGAPPADDVPHAGVTDDIPFATCSVVGLGEIAKVLS